MTFGICVTVRAKRMDCLRKPEKTKARAEGVVPSQNGLQRYVQNIVAQEVAIGKAMKSGILQSGKEKRPLSSYSTTFS